MFPLHEIHEEMKLTRTSSIAVVTPKSKEGIRFTKFYETVCVNRGWDVKIFDEREDAIEWLLKQSNKN
jgi:hypothetical protein